MRYVQPGMGAAILLRALWVPRANVRNLLDQHRRMLAGELREGAVGAAGSARKVTSRANLEGLLAVDGILVDHESGSVTVVTRSLQGRGTDSAHHRPARRSAPSVPSPPPWR